MNLITHSFHVSIDMRLHEIVERFETLTAYAGYDGVLTHTATNDQFHFFDFCGLDAAALFHLGIIIGDIKNETERCKNT